MSRIKKEMNLQKNNFEKLNSRKKPVANFIKFDMKDQPRSQYINCHQKNQKDFVNGFKIPVHLHVPIK